MIIYALFCYRSSYLTFEEISKALKAYDTIVKKNNTAFLMIEDTEKKVLNKNKIIKNGSIHDALKFLDFTISNKALDVWIDGVSS